MPLKVTAELKPGGSYVVLHAEGMIDATTAPVLGAEVDAVLEKKPGLLIFNLERVTFVSSAGIGVVLSAEKRMKAAGGKALLVNLKPHIRKVFDIVQALPSQQIYGSIQELDNYLAEIQRQVRDGESG
jgi:anti-anti-sigma factor